MTIRKKLLLGYLGFVLALAVLGMWGARTLNDMSAVSRRIISENYDSVVAAQDMKESLERQDSAAVFELLGQRERARSQAAEHRARFDAAFAKAAANITEAGEPDVVEAIRLGRDTYYRMFDDFLSSSGDRTAQYFGVLEPEFNRVRSDCDRLLRLNQDAMQRKAVAASAIARRWYFLTLGLLGVLMLVGVGVEFRLAKSILGPVRELTAATTKVAAEDGDAAVPVRSSDEIGTLAEGFNRMADRIRELRRSDLSQLRAAQQMVEAKSEFVANASRELRAPLTNVQLGLYLILEGGAGPLDERQQSILQDCRESAEQLDRLMKQLLELSSLEGGPDTAVRQTIRPSVLVRTVVEALRLQVEARDVKLEVDAPPDVPAVIVDRGRIERVLGDLVANAMRATPAGGGITVAAAEADGTVTLTVTDTGPGIPPEQMETIFEPFVQAPDAAPGGSGLVLAVARRVVEAEGGRLTIESEVGRGSTFVLTLPVGKGRPQSAEGSHVRSLERGPAAAPA